MVDFEALPVLAVRSPQSVSRSPRVDRTAANFGVLLVENLLNSADIKACLAFAADHEKTDPPWLPFNVRVLFFSLLAQT